MKQLPVNHACWTCTLTVKGKVTSLCLVIHRADRHWVLAPRWLLPEVQRHCGRYLIAEDVQIADVSSTWTILGVQGPQTPELLSRVCRSDLTCADQTWSDATWQDADVGVLGHAVFGMPGALCIVSSAQVVAWWQMLRSNSATPIGLLTLQMLRLEAGLAWYGVDVDDRCLLPETGWEHTATSYTKGCYVGQEVVARVSSQGQVQRHLVGLRLSTTTPPSTPCELLCGDEPCGSLTSAAFSPQHGTVIGLGMATRRAWTSGVTCRLRSPVDVTAQLLPLTALPLPT